MLENTFFAIITVHIMTKYSATNGLLITNLSKECVFLVEIILQISNIFYFVKTLSAFQKKIQNIVL